MPSHTLSRVLSVDDDEDACEMLSLLLKSEQIDLTCVRSAEEAWPRITTERFDLYLLDAWLPEIDGFELCRQIRDCDATTPILFYSAAAYDADKRRGIASGANDYVTKPDIDRLIKTMLDLIARASAKPSAAGWISAQSRPDGNWSSAPFFSLKTASD